MFELVLLAAALLISSLVALQRWRQRRPKSSRLLSDGLAKAKDIPAHDPYGGIEPLRDFDWRTEQPLRVRPFKPKYHLTMAIENITLSEFIAMDKTYLERVEHRQEVMDEHFNKVVQCNAPAEGAVNEFYRWMTATYLPKRFPKVFAIAPRAETSQPAMHNLATGKTVPLEPLPSPLQALETLGANVDTDFFFLLPSSNAADGSPLYHLQAFVTCFPSGFNTLSKLGKPLSEIHKPVPGYAAKLEKSMDRFFAKLECGKMVRRANWTITTSGALYCEAGNHLYADHSAASPAKNEKTLDVNGHNVKDEIERQRQEVVIEDCRLRCERQTLHRLPESKAIVFAFKTYQYTLADVKAEGDGPALAEAVEGMTLGSVPDMAFYKRQVVWGDKVAEYLRS